MLRNYAYWPCVFFGIVVFLSLSAYSVRAQTPTPVAGCGVVQSSIPNPGGSACSVGGQVFEIYVGNPNNPYKICSGDSARCCSNDSLCSVPTPTLVPSGGCNGNTIGQCGPPVCATPGHKCLKNGANAVCQTPPVGDFCGAPSPTGAVIATPSGCNSNTLNMCAGSTSGSHKLDISTACPLESKCVKQGSTFVCRHDTACVVPEDTGFGDKVNKALNSITTECGQAGGECCVKKDIAMVDEPLPRGGEPVGWNVFAGFLDKADELMHTANRSVDVPNEIMNNMRGGLCIDNKSYAVAEVDDKTKPGVEWETIGTPNKPLTEIDDEKYDIKSCTCEPFETGMGVFARLDNFCESVGTDEEKASCLACTQYGIWTGIGCVGFDISTFIQQTVFGWGIGFAGIIALMCIAYASFVLQTSQGTPEKITEAQELMTSCITGLIVIILSVFILRVIGVDLLRIPGFGDKEVAMQPWMEAIVNANACDTATMNDILTNFKADPDTSYFAPCTEAELRQVNDQDPNGIRCFKLRVLFPVEELFAVNKNNIGYACMDRDSDAYSQLVSDLLDYYVEKTVGP